MAYGEMGLSPHTFLFEISYGQFMLASNGYWKKQERITQIEYRQTRRLAWSVYCMLGGETPELDYMPLPGDPEEPEATNDAAKPTASGGIPAHLFLTMLVGREPIPLPADEPDANG